MKRMTGFFEHKLMVVSPMVSFKNTRAVGINTQVGNLSENLAVIYRSIRVKCIIPRMQVHELDKLLSCVHKAVCKTKQ